MPRPTLVPDKAKLEKYVRQGLSQSQMVDEWESETGVRVSRAAIGMAMIRLGVDASTPAYRYEDLMPWHVRPEHRMAYDARMLRREARRRRGLPSKAKDPEKDMRKLTAWLDRLQEANAVIMYNPDTVQGFWWVPRQSADDDIIRRPASE